MNVRSLVPALSRMPAMFPRKCAGKNCRRNVILTALHGKAAGISVRGQWFCGPQCFESALVEMLAVSHASAQSTLPAHRNRVPLGLTLLTRGALSEPQLKAALDEHRATGVRLGDIVQQLGFASEEQVTSALAEQWGHPVFRLRSAACDSRVSIPTRLLDLHSMLPVHYSEAGKRLLIGFADGVDYRVLDAVASVLPCAPSPCIIAASEYRRRLESIMAQSRGNEAVFNGKSSPREMAQIIRSYAVQIHAEEMRFANCGDHLWTRLNGRRHQMDILFRLARE